MQATTSSRQIRKEGNVSLIEKTSPETGKVVEYEIIQTDAERPDHYRKWYAGRLKDATRTFERIADEDRRARLRKFIEEHT